MKITNKNSALIVIDIINFCCQPKHTKIRRMVPRLVKFIQQYKAEFKGQVIYINCNKWNKKNLPKNLVELYKDPKCSYYTTDKTKHPEEFYKISPDKDDLIITKNNYDAFTNPKLDKFLKSKKIKYLIVTGIFGDGCVHSTIQGGFSKGYNFIILKDLIETTDEKIRQDLQKILKQYTWPIMFGKTTSSKQFLNTNSFES